MKESNQDSSRFRPRIGRFIALLQARRGHLPTLAEAKHGRPCTGQHHVGLRYVPISLIKGTLQRPYDFDQNFRLTQNHTRRRWESVNRAAEQGIDLPPVQLLKYGEDYFVSDGHHRVSVARYRGGQWVDAEVTELCPSPEP